MAFCSKCGAPMKDEARFCSACGVRQASAQSTQQPGLQQPETGTIPPSSPAYTPVKAAGKLSGMAKLFMALGALALVAAVVVFVILDPFRLFKSDETLIRERIQAYEDACNSGDYEAMLDCMDADARALMEGSVSIMDGIFSEGTGMDFGMSDMFGLAGATGDFYDIEITNIEIDGDHATVTVVMTANMYGYSTSTEEAELPMVKDGSDWYIGGLDNMIQDELLPMYQ